MAFKYDGTGVDLQGGYMVAPPAIYTLIIKEAKDKDDEGNPRISKKSGNPLVAVTCEIDDANEYLGTKIYHYVTFMPKGQKGAGMALNFLKTIGEPWEGQISVAPENWIGKRFQAKLKVEKDLKGKDRNQIAYLIENPDDEVPF